VLFLDWVLRDGLLKAISAAPPHHYAQSSTTLTVLLEFMFALDSISLGEIQILDFLATNLLFLLALKGINVGSLSIKKSCRIRH
jgi:hypothetical protein